MASEKKRFLTASNVIKLLVTSFFLFVVFKNIQWNDHIYLYKGDPIELGKVTRFSDSTNDFYYHDSRLNKEVHVFLNLHFNRDDEPKNIIEKIQSFFSSGDSKDKKYYMFETLPQQVGDPAMVRPLSRLVGHLKDHKKPPLNSTKFDFTIIVGDTDKNISITTKNIAGGIELGVKPSVPSLLRTINMGYFLTAFFLISLSQLLPAFRWKIIMSSGGMKMSQWKAIKLVYMGYFITQVLPSVGDIFRAVVVARENAVDRATAALSVFIDRIVGLFSVVIIGSVTILLQFNNPHIAPYRSQMFIPMILLFAFSVVYFSRSLRKITGFEWVLSHLPLGKKIREIEEKVFIYRTRKKALAMAFAITAVVQINFILVNYLLARSLGLPEGNLMHFFLIIPIITVIVAIPISMGGFGVRESLFMSLFTALGMNSGIGITTSILQWVILMVWSLPGGLALLSFKKEYKSEPFS